MKRNSVANGVSNENKRTRTSTGSLKPKEAVLPPPPAKREKRVSEPEVIDMLENFFVTGGNDSECLPKNEWSVQLDIDTLPLITVGDMTVKFPCDEQVCRQLIERCKLAPFGLGSETVLDKEIRNSWEADSSQVTFNSTAWQKMFCNSKCSPFLEKIRETLAPTCKRISAKFYKLLVYESGSFFKPHRDTQRDSHHFGTIVVFLPSSYTGGELVLRHIDKERAYSFSYLSDELKNDLLKCRIVSFFTDVEHEVKKLESGYRVALTYNLYFDGSRKPSVPPSVTAAEERLTKILHHAFALPSWKKKSMKIGAVMKHDYTMLSLKPELLKGGDKALYDAFNSSGKYDIELVPITVEAQGTGGGEDEYNVKAIYQECLVEGYPIEFKIRQRDFETLLKIEERKTKSQEDAENAVLHSNSEEDDDDSEEDYAFTFPDYFFDKDVISEFVWESSCEKPTKGKVFFVSDWRKVAADKVSAAGASQTGNEGVAFELRYFSATMIVKPKS